MTFYTPLHRLILKSPVHSVLASDGMVTTVNGIHKTLSSTVSICLGESDERM